MSTDPAAFLEAEFGRVEELARGVSVTRWMGSAMDMRDRMQADFLNVLDPSMVGPYFEVTAPEAVLRRVKADRALLADLLAERHLVVDGDCWFTCTAATEERDGGENCDDDRRGGPCDCGRDTRVERRVRLLAEAWSWEETA